MQSLLSDPMSLFNEMADSLDELAKTMDIMCRVYAIVCVLGKKAPECNRLHSEIPYWNLFKLESKRD